MKVIKLDYPHTYTQDDFPPLSIALGFFDGVHKGHQKVIRTAVQKAKENGWKSAVMTFYPHPLTVLTRKKKVHYITPLQDKIRLIEELGADYLFIVNFSEAFAAQLPQEFVDRYLINLHVKHVTAGFDYSYGRLGKGTMESLPFHAREQFSQTVVSKISENNEKISSTIIRASLMDGEVEKFLALTGRLYETTGLVIHGEKRGRTLGFPTANLKLDDEYIIPSVGVYAVKVKLKGKVYEGICNIGYKPTFHHVQPDKPNVEVHIFDFDESIYDQRLTVEWHLRLRSEKKFSSLEQLKAQISQDCLNAKGYFEKITS